MNRLVKQSCPLLMKKGCRNNRFCFESQIARGYYGFPGKNDGEFVGYGLCNASFRFKRVDFLVFF
jgi:hypothetical protein